MNFYESLIPPNEQQYLPSSPQKPEVKNEPKPVSATAVKSGSYLENFKQQQQQLKNAQSPAK